MKNLIVVALYALTRLSLALSTPAGLIATFTAVSGSVLLLTARTAVTGGLVGVGVAWAVTTAVLLVVLRRQVTRPVPRRAALPSVPPVDDDVIEPTALYLPARQPRTNHHPVYAHR